MLSSLKRIPPRYIAAIVSIILLFSFIGIARGMLGRYGIYMVMVTGVYIIAVASLNLTNGYTGQFSLAHAAFMLIGAYTSTLLTFPLALRKAYELPLLPTILGGHNFCWPFLPALLMGGLLAAFGAILVGLPVLRLRGHYLAVASLGFMVIVTTLAKALTGLTRGPAGISAIPHYSNLWWVYGWVVVTIYVVWRIVNSSYGRAMLAIREDEIAAQTQGINLLKYKLTSFIVGAFFAGIAGGLYAHFTRAIRPHEFSYSMTFYQVIMLTVGGQGTMAGPIIGVVLLMAIKFGLKPLEEGLGLYGLIELIYAALLIIIMLWRPEGIAGRKIDFGRLIKSISPSAKASSGD